MMMTEFDLRLQYRGIMNDDTLTPEEKNEKWQDALEAFHEDQQENSFGGED